MTQINSVPKFNDITKDVVKLQEALKAKGFYDGSIDGNFRSKTKAGVSAFQKSKGLPGSGEIGPKTLKLLGLEVVAVNPVTNVIAITSNLKGKRENRVLHPSMRIGIEAKVFPNGAIPQCFINRDLVACAKLVSDALLSMAIREKGGNNRGQKVGEIQSVIGSYTPGGNGDAWCMSAMQCLIAFLEDYFQVESPVEDSELCTAVFAAAKNVPGLVAAELIQEGGILIGQYKPKKSGHTGFVKKKLSKTVCVTNEGNTGDASVNDGDGYYEKTRDITKTKPLVILGTVLIYPNNAVPARAG